MLSDWIFVLFLLLVPILSFTIGNNNGHPWVGLGAGLLIDALIIALIIAFVIWALKSVE